MTYLELSALFAGPVKLAKWRDAPPGVVGLVAPFPLTHRQPPKAQKLWPHSPATGDFRVDTPALTALRDAIGEVHAGYAIFRSPDAFSPSAANREQLHRFFGEVTLPVPRVWVPGGLWEPRAAAKLATELGVTCAIDPLVRDPQDPPEIHYDLEVESLYLRIAGRAGVLRTEQLEDLAALVEHYASIPLVVAFASPERWQDARNFKKLIDG